MICIHENKSENALRKCVLPSMFSQSIIYTEYSMKYVLYWKDDIFILNQGHVTFAHIIQGRFWNTYICGDET